MAVLVPRFRHAARSAARRRFLARAAHFSPGLIRRPVRASARPGIVVLVVKNQERNLRIPCRLMLAPAGGMAVCGRTSSAGHHRTAESHEGDGGAHQGAGGRGPDTERPAGRPPLSALQPPPPIAAAPAVQRRPRGYGATGRRRRRRRQGAESRHQRDRRFPRRGRQSTANRAHAVARNARKRSRLPGSHRPLRARRFLHQLRRAGRRSGRRLPHLHLAARRPAVEGRARCARPSAR